MPKKAAAVEPQGIVGDIIEDKIKSIRRRIRNGLRVEDIIERLTSRKFWLTVGVLLFFMWNALHSKDAQDAAVIYGYLTQVVIAFLAIQGSTDALTKVFELRTTQKALEQNNYNNNGELDQNVLNASINSMMNSTMNQNREDTIPGD